MGVLFFFIGICVLLLLFGIMIEYTESPEFCGNACHPYAGVVVHDAPMEPYYESYVEPDNNSIMKTHHENDVTCSNCHDAPGVTGKAQAYVAAIKELFVYVTGDYDADNLEGHVPDEYCTKCHDGDVATKPGKIIGINNETVNPHDKSKNCADCHEPHQKGTGYSTEECNVCHDLDEREIENHGATTDEDCVSCHYQEHDREQPLQMRIYFSEPIVENLINNNFCGDCHGTQWDGHSKWTDEKIEFYENCTSCHSEHKQTNAIPDHNLNSDPFKDNCDYCHNDPRITHDFYNVSYSSFILELNNDYCSGCHKEEFDLVVEDQCTNCHEEHEEPPRTDHSINSPFDDCSECHFELLSKHNLTNVAYIDFTDPIPNEFCRSCHLVEFNELNDDVHSNRLCLDCHTEHKQINVDFVKCSLCHDKIPNTHNESKTECRNCHTLDNIHG
jgi:hypothetical protein